MHILYFHQHFATPSGSCGTRSYELARRSVERGHSVTLVCGTTVGSAIGLDKPFVRGRREGLVDGIRVIELDLQYTNYDGLFKRTGTFIRYALHSIGIALKESYDVVFATTTPLTAAIPGMAGRWIRRKPFVFEVRDLWPELPRATGVITNPVVLGLMSVLEWSAYRSAHLLVGLSPGIVEGIQSRGVDSKKICMVPNGCDLDMFSSLSESWRPSGVAEDDFMAVYTGTHGICNGLDAVLGAARVLKQRNVNNIKMVLVGDGRLKDSLVKTAIAEDLNSVVFHPPVSKPRIAELMQSADIGMQLLSNVPAFYFGTSPNKFFDYIAAGIPVLNNYPGWVATLLTQNEAGCAVPPDDPEAFADALQWCADNPDELKRRGKNSRLLAETQFDRDKLAEQWIDWIERAYSIE